MRHDPYEIEVLVHGRPAREYPLNGDIWLEGRLGSEFTLRFRNSTARRVEVVLSIDGLSVMNGQTASKDDRGYIVGPYQTADIPGWRLNDREVAKFFFGKLDEAYASKMGKPQNIGVIGAAVFTERQSMPLSTPVFRGGATRGGGEMFSMTTKGGVGTGFGDRAEHQVSRTTFVRASQVPAAQFALRYETAEELTARGIVVGGPHDRVAQAQPFPADAGCQPPVDWRG